MLPKKSYPLILYLSPFFLRPISCATFLPPVFMIVFLHCLPPVVLLTGGWHHNFWKIKELLSFQEKIQLFTSSDSLLQFQQKIATGRRKTVKIRIHWTGGQGGWHWTGGSGMVTINRWMNADTRKGCWHQTGMLTPDRNAVIRQRWWHQTGILTPHNPDKDARLLKVCQYGQLRCYSCYNQLCCNSCRPASS